MSSNNYCLIDIHTAIILVYNFQIIVLIRTILTVQLFLNCFQDAELVESLWKVDLDYGTSMSAPPTAESRGASPYDSFNFGSFLSPGDDLPSRNFSFSRSSDLSTRRWYLPPNSSDFSASSSSYQVKKKKKGVYRTLSIL